MEVASLKELKVWKLDQLLDLIEKGRYVNVLSAKDQFAEDLHWLMFQGYEGTVDKVFHKKLLDLIWEWSNDWKPSYRTVAKQYKTLIEIVRDELETANYRGRTDGYASAEYDAAVRGD